MFIKTAPAGAYEDGYKAGCNARKRGSNYQARDADARSHLQGRYRKGWARGYSSCEPDKASAWKRSDRERQRDQECSKHDRKRGRCGQ